MAGVRLDRFLASTAVVLFLSAAAGGVLAEPKFGSRTDATIDGPEATANTAPPAGEPSQPAAKPAEPAAETPAPAPKPQVSTEPPAAATLAPAVTATPDPSTDQPAAASASPAAAPPASPSTAEQSTEQPATPATAEVPPAKAQPDAALTGDEVPAPAVPALATTPSEPAAATAASVVVDPNAPVADQLRDLANGKFDRIIGGKKERAAFEAFYSARNYAPIWINDGQPNARAKAAIAYLGQVDTDGLDPADYPVPHVAATTDPTALAEAEIRLSASVAAYAHHAQVGRVHWTRVSGDISYDQKPSTAAEVLAKLTDANDAAEVLAAYEPQHPAYLALKAKLAELRDGKDDAGRAPIANGPALKIGVQDERVPQLRERLGDPRGDGDTTYDKTLADAVKKFQQQHELKVTGTLTAATLDALNGRRPDRPIDTIIVNLERWRWAPHDLGKNYVIVNLPDFTLRVMQDGKELWKTKIVEGKPEMPTPIMSAEMKFITVNPTWNVPPSIVAREYMPALQQDPTVLERMGLKVSSNPDGTVHISQPPGEQNALGRLRFNFPNKFLVYQHDTPNKNLFALEKRAFSHGCMRVQDPVKYAEVLLSVVRPGDGYTQDRIRKMFGQSEADIQFPKFLPVHLTYQTAFVDDDGTLQFRDDIYGRDKALLAILKGDERRVADTAIERRENTVRREVLAMPDQWSGRYGGGGFFSRLFGGPSFAAPPPLATPAPRRQHSAQRKTEIH
jgi:murein L,D-transpeptidase YcbB/YkuD